MAPKWVDDLNREVIERDEGLCIICGAPAKYPPHHIVPRGRAPKWSERVWRADNMACVCLKHHDNTRQLRVRLVDRMAEKHEYDMSWVREHMIWES